MPHSLLLSMECSNICQCTFTAGLVQLWIHSHFVLCLWCKEKQKDAIKLCVMTEEACNIVTVLMLKIPHRSVSKKGQRGTIVVRTLRVTVYSHPNFFFFFSLINCKLSVRSLGIFIIIHMLKV